MDLKKIPPSAASQLEHTPLLVSHAHPTEGSGAGGMVTPPKGDDWGFSKQMPKHKPLEI